MSWFSPTCPVDDDTRFWVEDNVRWLLTAFEFSSAKDVAVVLPTPEFFPDPYAGSERDVRRLFLRVCDLMEVDGDRLRLKLIPDAEGELRHHLPAWESSGEGAAGLYHGNAETAVIRISLAHREDPMAMVAVMAHELGHVLLLGDEQISGDEEDHEPLTDLLTVAMGMGIFNANSAFKFGQWSGGGMHGWSAGRLGYLDEETWGYALAYFAWLREETKPVWAQFLEGDVKHYFKAGMKFLRNQKNDSVAPENGV